jgi:MinD superfamily P-loop ATPase
MVTRQIVRIDEQLCNGCGLCVIPCAEGAIELVDGKARVLREELCDGAGFCLGVCPTGALTIEERETVAFNDAAVGERQRERRSRYMVQSCFQCGGSEEESTLLPCRRQGQSLWVCTRCLPALIHR